MLCALLFLLVGCGHSDGAALPKPNNLSAWVAYWDIKSAEQETKKLKNKLDTIVYFGAFFDSQDKLSMPAELTTKRLADLKKETNNLAYLSVINDRQTAEEKIILKDTEILKEIFSSPDRVNEHINELIAIAQQGKFDGLDIDYERIWKDEQVAAYFPTFVAKLYTATQISGLKLRIVLEPGTPFDKVKFIEGPEYVVMFYNLKGTHSGPGPKADTQFIKRIITKMQTLPGERTVALATGGCRWGSNGSKKYISELEAKALAKTMGAKIKRDKDSQCAIFNYVDRGTNYEVWYADDQTISYWIKTAMDAGETRIAIWRLGGNQSLHKLF